MQYRIIPVCLAVLLGTGCAHLRPDSRDTVLIITFVNVGYGDAIILQTGASACLIDGGYPTVTAMLLDTIRDLGITGFDSVVLTHPHPDHIGGLHGILASGFPAKAFYCPWNLDSPDIPSGFRNVILNQRIPYHEVKTGDTIPITDDLVLAVLHPDHPEPDLNESSLVLFCPVPERGLLLTGDIGPNGQALLMKRYPELFPVTILKAPHHAGESLESFYENALPQVTVICDGINPYGNPWQTTLDAAERWSGRVIRLSHSGTVQIRIPRSGQEIHSETDTAAEKERFFIEIIGF
ncbi:MBL fold metallo-hydrolase [bacterium]|nr:MBL fold metallo-hydrolase [candidate division CSSED10-310 bacterium]